jgi:hypothetical protein
MRRYVVLLAVAALLTACSSSSGAPAAATSAAATSAAPTSAAPTSAAPTTAGLTGFGATVGAWNAHHTADSDFTPGSVYNPDPTLPQINGHTGAIYVAVIVLAGRVENYTMNLHPSGLAAAIAVTMREMPSDATILWKAARDTCWQAEVKSAAIAHALGTNDPQGQAMIELSNQLADGSAAAAPKTFNNAILTLDASTTAAAAPAC